jgi:hypothetical protein
MRLALYRGLGVAALLIPCAAGVTAHPPSTLDKLKADTAALAGERATAESNSAERAKLQADLRRLLDRIDKAPAPGPMNPPSIPVAPPKSKENGTGGGSVSVDQLRAAMNLVQGNSIEAALYAFQQMDLQRLAPEDRAFARYMQAACLRRLGRVAEALPIYREVGNGGEDPFYSSAATSQVALIRTSEELQVQLAQLRARPKSR